MARLSAIEEFEKALSVFSDSSKKESLQNLARDGQSPKAIVVACADSRVAPEILFGAELGQLFVIRVAGNVVGVNELASIEYAALALKVPLCIVLGHSQCGAVSASVDWVQEKISPPTKSLEALVKDIEPAVSLAMDTVKSGSNEVLPEAINENIKRVVQVVSNQSPQLKSLIENGEFAVKGCLVDMANVKLQWI